MYVNELLGIRRPNPWGIGEELQEKGQEVKEEGEDLYEEGEDVYEAGEQVVEGIEAAMAHAGVPPRPSVSHGTVTLEMGAGQHPSGLYAPAIWRHDFESPKVPGFKRKLYYSEQDDTGGAHDWRWTSTPFGTDVGYRLTAAESAAAKKQAQTWYQDAAAALLAGDPEWVADAADNPWLIERLRSMNLLSDDEADIVDEAVSEHKTEQALATAGEVAGSWQTWVIGGLLIIGLVMLARR